MAFERCMKLAALALVLAACHAPTAPTAPTAPVAHHASAPPKLGPTVTAAQLAALQPLAAERREDGPQAMHVGDTPWVTVDGNLLSALACRPDGSSPSLVTDGHYVYVTYHRASHLAVLPGAATPSTYCSYQRFVIPDGLEPGGQLAVR